MSSTFTPFGLQQVVPVVNSDGSIGWQFLGGLNLPEFLNPLTGITPPDGAVTWSNLKDALGYPPEMLSGGANTIQMLATYLARGGGGLQATAEVKAQDNVHGSSAALDVNGDGTITLESSSAGGGLASAQLWDGLARSAFLRHWNAKTLGVFGPYVVDSGVVAAQNEASVVCPLTNPPLPAATTSTLVIPHEIKDSGAGFAARLTWRHEGVNQVTKSDTFHFFNATAGGGVNAQGQLTFSVICFA